MAVINTFLGGGDPAAGDRVESQPMNFTSRAGMTSLLVALAGSVGAVLQIADAWKLTDTRLLGAFGLVAAGIIGFAIASAGDALARAYTAAWVVERKDSPGEHGTTQVVPAHPAVLDMKPATLPGGPGPQRNGEVVHVHAGQTLIVDR